MLKLGGAGRPDAVGINDGAAGLGGAGGEKRELKGGST
jgi:hypothetical protein